MALADLLPASSGVQESASSASPTRPGNRKRPSHGRCGLASNVVVDPGWLPAVRLVPRGLFLPLLFGTARTEPRIVVMRVAFMAIVGGLAVVLLAAPAVADVRDRSLSPAIAAARCRVGRLVNRRVRVA